MSVSKKRKPAQRKTTGKKKTGLKGTACVRINSDGSRTTYSQQGGSQPCPYGGNVQEVKTIKKKPLSLSGAAKNKKRTSGGYATKAEALSKTTGRLKKGYRYDGNGRIVRAKTTAAPRRRKTTAKRRKK